MAFYNALSHLLFITIPQGGNWGSGKRRNSSKANRCSAAELRSRARAFCPQSLPLATKPRAKVDQLLLYSPERERLASDVFGENSLASLPQSQLCLSSFPSALPPWFLVQNLFPRLDSASLAWLPASLLTAWFPKAASGPRHTQDSAAPRLSRATQLLDCRHIDSPLHLLKIKNESLS